jgi:hypothetical protein
LKVTGAFRLQAEDAPDQFGEEQSREKIAMSAFCRPALEKLGA